MTGPGTDDTRVPPNATRGTRFAGDPSPPWPARGKDDAGTVGLSVDAKVAVGTMSAEVLQSGHRPDSRPTA